MRVVTGIPLLWVARKKLLPKDEREEPSTRKPDSKYLTIDDKMIACGPIILEGKMGLVGKPEHWEKPVTWYWRRSEPQYGRRVES